MFTNFKNTAKLKARIKRIKLKYQAIGWRECVKVYEEQIERIHEKHEIQIADTRKEEEDKQAQRVADLLKQVDNYKLSILKNQSLVDENLRQESFLREWGLNAERGIKGIEADLGKVISKFNEMITPIIGRSLRLAKKESKEMKAIESRIEEQKG